MGREPMLAVFSSLRMDRPLRDCPAEASWVWVEELAHPDLSPRARPCCFVWHREHVGCA